MQQAGGFGCGCRRAQRLSVGLVSCLGCDACLCSFFGEVPSASFWLCVRPLQGRIGCLLAAYSHTLQPLHVYCERGAYCVVVVFMGGFFATLQCSRDTAGPQIVAEVSNAHPRCV